MAEKAKIMRRSTYWLVAAAFLFALLTISPGTRSWECPNVLTALLPDAVPPAGAAEQGPEATIGEFRAWARYKAVRLTWEAHISPGEQVTFAVYRSMARPDGEYSLLTSIQGTPEVQRYEYIDKTVPVEENYFYKIEIPETKEAFGPLQARPPFSRPST